MDRLDWDHNIKTGNKEIDKQHLMFTHIIKKLIRVKNTSDDKRLLESVLAELIKFTEFHFCSEENIMREHGYPHFLEHRKEHERLLALLRNRFFSLQYEYIDFENFEAFLHEWFIQHVPTDDAKLARFIQENSL